jgi:maleylpyruvate isomerase
MAIMEYLEETHPNPPLLPKDPVGRVRVRALSLIPTADIHPIQNLRVMAYLREKYEQSEEGTFAWSRHWIETGFQAYEASVAGNRHTGAYSHGDQPTMADLCLVPQLGNARRFGVDVQAFPRLLEAETAAKNLKAFADAAPERQPDAE